MYHFLAILLHFITLYALEAIYIYCIFMVEILHNNELHISFQLHSLTFILFEISQVGSIYTM